MDLFRIFADAKISCTLAVQKNKHAYFLALPRCSLSSHFCKDNTKSRKDEALFKKAEEVLKFRLRERGFGHFRGKNKAFRRGKMRGK